MHRFPKYITAAAVLLAAALTAAAIPQKPYPPRLVNDFAGILDQTGKAMLEKRLDAFSDSTSNQITVVTVNDLEGYSPAEYGTEIGLAWGVGSAEFDNGIVILVKPKTAESGGQVNISIGYGLEGAIPDSYAKRIIENEMIPAFSRNDYYSGISGACDVLMKLASGEISQPYPDEGDGRWGALFMLLLIIFVISFAVSRKKGKNDGNGRNGSGGGSIMDDSDFVKGLIIGNILGNSGHHSGWSGGGSIGGGFGGGFGGFGGGSFGGGGASGSW